MATCDIEALLEDATEFNGIGNKDLNIAQLQLASNIMLALDPDADVSVESLLADASEFSGLSNRDLEIAQSQLLCEIYNAVIDNTVLSLQPLVWYAARKEAFTDGSLVALATDWTGNGYHAVQPTESARPAFDVDGLNGRPSFRFNTGDYLTGSGFTQTQPDTILVVFQHDTENAGLYIHGADNNINRQALYTGSSGPNAIHRIFAGTNLNGASTVQSGVPILSIAQYDGTSSFLRKNGVEDASGNAGTNSIQGVTIGSNFSHFFWFPGVISEFIIFPRKLSATEISKLESLYNGVFGLGL